MKTRRTGLGLRFFRIIFVPGAFRDPPVPLQFRFNGRCWSKTTLTRGSVLGGQGWLPSFWAQRQDPQSWGSYAGKRFC